MKNTGKPFENLIARVAAAYAASNVLTMEKVAPPTITFRKAGAVITKNLENPFLDFVGVWTERGNRCLMLEAKSTHEPRLPLGTLLTENQINALARWHNAGAAVGVLWEYKTEVRFASIFDVVKARREGRASIHARELEPLRQGRGFVLFDFAAALRETYP